MYKRQLYRIASVEVLNKVRDVFLNSISRFPYRLVVTFLADNVLNIGFTTSSSAVSNRIDNLFNVLFNLVPLL